MAEQKEQSGVSQAALAARRAAQISQSEVSSSVTQRSEEAVGVQQAPTSALLHEQVGNEIVRSSLAGEGGSFGSHVAGLMGAEAAGMLTGGMSENSAVNLSMASEGLQPTQSDMNALRPSGGKPLKEGVRRRFEMAFNKDFGAVRVHDGAAAGKAATALNAHALAIENHIFFAQGQFAPGSKWGDTLLAHELTHVVQHQEGRLPSTTGSGMEVSNPSDAVEVEAYRNQVVIAKQLPQIDAVISLESQVGQKLGLNSPILENIERAGGGELSVSMGQTILGRLGEASGAGVSAESVFSDMSPSLASAASSFLPGTSMGVGESMGVASGAEMSMAGGEVGGQMAGGEAAMSVSLSSDQSSKEPGGDTSKELCELVAEIIGEEEEQSEQSVEEEQSSSSLTKLGSAGGSIRGEKALGGGEGPVDPGPADEAGGGEEG